MLIIHFILALASAASVSADTSDCEPLLLLKPGPEVELATLDKMSDLLSLNAAERGHVQAYVRFYAEALRARAANRSLSTLHSPYLVEQSRRLQAQIQTYLDRWSGFQIAIQETLERRVTAMQNAIEDMEEQLRNGKTQELVERKKREIVGTLNRVSRQYQGEDANLEDFAHAIESLSANPERQLFQMKQNFKEYQDKVARDQKLAQANSDRALAMLELIQLLLSRRDDQIDFQTLVQLEVATAVVDEAAQRGFYRLPKQVEFNEDSFASAYGITFDDVERGLQSWPAGKAKTLGKDISDLVKRWDLQFKKLGALRLPIIGTLSQREALAIAFLPVHPLRFQQERGWVSDMETEPHRGSVVTLFDISGGGELGYKTAAFTKREPEAWLEALNSSFTNWYLLLGGSLEATPLRRPNPTQDILIRALLFYARYLPHEERGAEWTSANALAEFFFKEFASWDQPDRHLFDPNLREFFKSRAPEFFNELGLARGTGESKLTDAVDQILARILRSPGLQVSDTNLRQLFERFPTTAFSAKMLVLKAVHGEPKPEPRGETPL